MTFRTDSYNLSGGTLVSDGFSGGSGRSTVNFNGGTLQVSDFGGVITNLTAANVLSGGAVFNVPSAAQLLVNSPRLNGTGGAADGGLTKLGAGVAVVSGANTYTGSTNVSAGALFVNGSTSPAGVVRIAAGAFLAGNGSVGAVTVAGTIQPTPNGSTVANLSTGMQTWNGSGTYVALLSGSTADRLVMSGLTVAATAADKFTVYVANSSSFSLARYVLAVDRGANGGDPFTLAALNLEINGAAAPAEYSLTEGTDKTGAGGYDLLLVVAPEPSSLLLLGVGGLPLTLGRRRRAVAIASTPGCRGTAWPGPRPRRPW